MRNMYEPVSEQPSRGLSFLLLIFFISLMNSTFNVTSPELIYFQTTLIKTRNNSSAQTQEPQHSFKCPNYLKLTHYENLLNEHQKISKHRDSEIWKYTSIIDQQTEELDLRLPTNWNPKDKSKNIDISSNGLDLLYIGKSNF